MKTRNIRDSLDSWGLRAVNRGDLIPGTEFWFLTPEALSELDYDESPQSSLLKMVLGNPAVKGGRTVYFQLADTGTKGFMPVDEFLCAENFLCVVRKISGRVSVRR